MNSGGQGTSYEWQWAGQLAEERGSELLAHNFVHAEPLVYDILINSQHNA